MAEMLDCLVSYYSAKAHRGGMPLQYLCYRIVGGPGSTPEGGVAAITLLAAKNPNAELYHFLHAVQEGGPRAAVAAALNYLDAVHHKSDLTRVQTEVRSTPCVERRPDDDLPPIDLSAHESAEAAVRSSHQGITVLNTRHERRKLF
jgi:hypothetical protein